MYYSHNLHFVSYARMAQGRFEEALDYSRRLRKNVDGAIEECRCWPLTELPMDGVDPLR